MPTSPASNQVSAGTLATLSALEVRAATAASERAGTSIRAHCRSGGLNADPSLPIQVFGADPNVNLPMSRFLTPPRRALALGILAGLIGAAAIALLAGGCAGNSTTSAQAPSRTRPPETIFEAQSE